MRRFFFNDAAATEIYTLTLPDAHPRSVSFPLPPPPSPPLPHLYSPLPLPTSPLPTPTSLPLPLPCLDSPLPAPSLPPLSPSLPLPSLPSLPLLSMHINTPLYCIVSYLTLANVSCHSEMRGGRDVNPHQMYKLFTASGSDSDSHLFF